MSFSAMKPRRTKPFTPSTASYVSFGTDYSKAQPSPPVQQQRPRAPPVMQKPVNAAPPPQMDEPDTSSCAKVWTGTLRSSGGPRPWEQENAASEYIMPSQREAMQEQQSQRPKPPVSPKPARPQQQPVRPTPVTPQKQIIVRSDPSDSVDPQEGPRAVHLQYNSPMGLYSNANVQDAYSVQTHGQNVDP